MAIIKLPNRLYCSIHNLYSRVSMTHPLCVDGNLI